MVELVFYSERFTYNEQMDVYNNQRDLSEDVRAALVYNTCLTIAADESTFGTVY